MPLPGVCPRCDYLHRCQIPVKVATEEIAQERAKEPGKASVKQILPPLLVFVADQPHQLPRCM